MILLSYYGLWKITLSENCFPSGGLFVIFLLKNIFIVLEKLNAEKLEWRNEPFRLLCSVKNHFEWKVFSLWRLLWSVKKKSLSEKCFHFEGSFALFLLKSIFIVMRKFNLLFNLTCLSLIIWTYSIIIHYRYILWDDFFLEPAHIV